MTSVLIIEDDLELCGIFRQLLGNDMNVTHVASLQELRVFFQESPDPLVDLCIADLLLPDGVLSDALENCADIGRLKEFPILVVSVNDDQGLLETCLESWADDYITKPFNHNEFTVRCQRILNSNRSIRDEEVPILSPITLKVHFAGHISSESLTAQEVRVFNVLLAAPNWCVATDDLASKAWEEVKVRNKIRVTISRLRKKLDTVGLSIEYQENPSRYRLMRK